MKFLSTMQQRLAGCSVGIARSMVMLCLMSSMLARSQNRTPYRLDFQSCFGSTNSDKITAVAPAPNGGLWLEGTASFHDGTLLGVPAKGTVGEDLWVIRLDDHDQILFQRRLGGSNSEEGYLGIATRDGGFLAGGNTGSHDGDVQAQIGNVSAGWVAKVSNNGDVEWATTLHSLATCCALMWAAVELPTGEIVVAGQSTGSYEGLSAHLGQDGYVALLSNNGAMRWERCFGGSDDDELFGAVATPDSCVVLAGFTASSDGDISGRITDSVTPNRDGWLLKVDRNGSILWQKYFGGTSADAFNTVTLAPDGGILAAGSSSSHNGGISSINGSSDSWLVKCDSSGRFEWQRTFGGSNREETYAICIALDSSIFLVGKTNSIDGDVSGQHRTQSEIDSGFFLDDGWIVKCTSTGELLWQTCVGGSAAETLRSAYAPDDSSLVAAGFTQSNDFEVHGNHGVYDGWLVRLSASHTSVVGASPTISANTIRCYPNPASSLTRLQLSDGYQVLNASLLNLLGRDVTQRISSSEGEAVLNTDNLPDGIYFARVTLSSQGSRLTRSVPVLVRH